MVNRPITKKGFTSFIGMFRDYVSEQNGRDEYKEIIEELLALAEIDLTERALTGGYNAAVAIFLLKNNHGMKDKTEQEVKSDNVVKITFD